MGRESASPDPLELLTKSVLSARKYRTVDVRLVRTIGAAELGKGRSLKDAVKATKSRLHQSAAVYFQPNLNYKRALEQLQNAVAAGNQAHLRTVLRELMSGHASTKERLPILDQLYPEIFSALPPVQSILDVACGLHPLSLPWMPLSPDVSYTAWDIFGDQIRFLNRFFALMGYAGRAEQVNVLDRPLDPEAAVPPADVAFLLKTLPCLDQIENGAGQRVLHAVNARFLIVSFPCQSLGGRQKGMAKNYTTYFETILADTGWQANVFTYPTELVYVVRKG